MTEKQSAQLITDESSQIVDESSDHTYFTIVLNCLWSKQLGLSYHDRELYSFYKRVAGEQSVCYYSLRRISEITGLSNGQIRESRDILAKKGLIKTWKQKRNSRGWPVCHVIIVDYWKQNLAICEAENESNRASRAQFDIPPDLDENGINGENRAQDARNSAPHARSRAPGAREEELKEEPKEKQDISIAYPPVAAPRASKPAKQPREPRAPREPDAATAAALERLAETESVVAPYREAFLGAYGVEAGDMPKKDLAEMTKPILTFLGFASKPGAQDLAACACYYKALWKSQDFVLNNALSALRLVVKGYASWASERPGPDAVKQRQPGRPARPQVARVVPDRKAGDARHYGGTPEDRARIQASIDPHEWDWLKEQKETESVKSL